MGQQEITWNLTEIFPSASDSTVEKAIANVVASAEALEKRCRGKIASFTSEELLQCIRESETFQAKLQDISLYASLLFSANMTSPEAQALHDRVSKLEARLGKQLAVFSLELGSLVKSKPQLIDDPVLAVY